MDLVRFLKRNEDLHSLLIFSSLAKLGCLLYFLKRFWIVFIDDNCQHFLVYNLIAFWGLLLLVYHNSLSRDRLLAHEWGHLWLIKLRLHFNGTHVEALSSHHLLLLWVVSHVLMVDHARLHVKELTIHIRATNILLSLGLVVLPIWSLVLWHVAIVLEHSSSWIHRMWNLASNLRHVATHLLRMESTRSSKLLMATHRVHIHTRRLCT